MVSPRRIVRLHTVSSTNDEARRLAAAGEPEWTVVVADSQTAGRGRQGRSWKSPEGGLWFSVIIRPPPERASLLPVALGLSCAEAVHGLVGADVRLKWPNDLMLGGRKLGGILIEPRWVGSHLEYVVAGVGINLANPAERLDDGTLTATIAAACDRDELLDGILDRLIEYLKEDAAAIVNTYSRRCETLGKEVGLPKEAGGGTGRAIGVSHDGRLIVEREGNRMLLSAMVE